MTSGSGVGTPLNPVYSTVGLYDIYTTTMTHKRGDGEGNLTTIASALQCTPADALTPNNLQNDYPTNKLFSLRQVFTDYMDVVEGDYIELANTGLYAVRGVNYYEGLGPMSSYCQLIVEKELVYSA